MQVDLRDATGQDGEFLFRLHSQTVREYVELTFGDWDDEWQRDYFAKHFDPSKIKIVQLDGADIGMISVQRSEDEAFIEELQIVPEYQSRGIGSFLIRKICSESESRGVPVNLGVLKVNPARRLYERLGFRPAGESQTHYFMEWG